MLADALTAAVGWNSAHPWQAVIPRVATTGAFVLVGLWAGLRPMTQRFGTLLLVVGVAAGLALLNGSSDPGLYTIGRLMVPVAEIGLISATLAFPSGRLAERRDRRLVAFLVAMTAVFWIPTMLATQSPPFSGSLVRCGNSCPSNVLAVTERPHLAALTANLYFVGIFVALIAVVAILWRRYRVASPVRRRGLAVVITAGSVYAAALAAYAGLRVSANGETLTDAMGWILIATQALIPIAFLAGLVRERLFANAVLQTLVADLGRAPDADAFQEAVRRAVADPTLQLVRQSEGQGLVDLSGRPVADPSPTGEFRLWRRPVNGWRSFTTRRSATMSICSRSSRARSRLPTTSTVSGNVSAP